MGNTEEDTNPVSNGDRIRQADDKFAQELKKFFDKYRVPFESEVKEPKDELDQIMDSIANIGEPGGLSAAMARLSFPYPPRSRW